MKIKFITLALTILLIVGCSNLQEKYVEADMRTYHAVAPNLLELYSSIEDAEERKVKLNTIKTWGQRIEEGLSQLDVKYYFQKVEVPH